LPSPASEIAEENEKAGDWLFLFEIEGKWRIYNAPGTSGKIGKSSYKEVSFDAGKRGNGEGARSSGRGSSRAGQKKNDRKKGDKRARRPA